MRVAESRIRMLSVGTATANYRPAEPAEIGDGAVDWLSDGRLILTLISVQQQHVQAMMEDRLKDRYLHLDADWPIGADLGIDIATDKAAQILIGLAGQTVAEPAMRKAERAFLGR